MSDQAGQWQPLYARYLLKCVRFQNLQVGGCSQKSRITKGQRWEGSKIIQFSYFEEENIVAQVRRENSGLRSQVKSLEWPSDAELSRHTMPPRGPGIQKGKNSGQQTQDSSSRESLLHRPRSRAKGKTPQILSPCLSCSRTYNRNLLVILLGSTRQLDLLGPPCILSFPSYPSAPLHLHPGIFSILTVASNKPRQHPSSNLPNHVPLFCLCTGPNNSRYSFTLALKSLTSSRKTSTIAPPHL